MKFTFWNNDRKLNDLVTELKWVPYQINKKRQSYKVGSVYWSGYWHYVYKVISYDTETKYVTIEYEDGTTNTHCTALDPMRDYELRSYESIGNMSNYEYLNNFNPINNKTSYTMAEIKAMMAIGVIKEKYAKEIMYDFINDNSSPKDEYYYFINNNSNSNKITLVRDFKKSPKKKKGKSK